MSKQTPAKTPVTLAKITNLNADVEINGDVYQLFKKHQLENLLKQNREYSADIEGLKKAVFAILSLIGLLDPETMDIKAKIKSGDEGYQKHILKALKDVTVLLMTSSISPSAEARLKEKFAFIKEVLPIVEKYAGANFTAKPDEAQLSEAKILKISDK